MSLDKSIQSGQEKRQPYRGAKAVDTTCRNHGSCPWCEGGRQYRHKKILQKAAEIYKEWDDDEDEEYIPFWEQVAECEPEEGE